MTTAEGASNAEVQPPQKIPLQLEDADDKQMWAEFQAWKKLKLEKAPLTPPSQRGHLNPLTLHV